MIESLWCSLKEKTYCTPILSDSRDTGEYIVHIDIIVKLNAKHNNKSKSK